MVGSTWSLLGEQDHPSLVRMHRGATARPFRGRRTPLAEEQRGSFETSRQRGQAPKQGAEIRRCGDDGPIDAYELGATMTTVDVGWVAGVLVVLDVIAVYAFTLGIRRACPPSHPWSGIALLLLAVGMVRLSSAMPAQWPMVFGVLAAALWTVAALVR